MFHKTVSFFSLLFILALFFTAIFAQNDVPPPPTPRPVVRPVSIASGSGNGSGYSGEADDDGKVTGATIRGKVVYEDTGRPLRFVAIGFVKSTDTNNTYSTKFVKTDENGDFVIKNVKAGTFLPIIKSDGILNPTSYANQLRQSDKKAEIENLFEKIEVPALGEFQVLVRAKRGGSIIGKVIYADGEVAVGIKVEALIKQNDVFQTTSYGDFSVGTATTDDRGVYRFAGLPEGKYIVRAIEPVSHNEAKIELWEARSSYGQESQMLMTYYPASEKSDKATELDVGIGQEQSDININLPERKLFRISGKVIDKTTQKPLKDFQIMFYKLDDLDQKVARSMPFGAANTAKTDSLGNWALRSIPKGKYVITAIQGYVYRNPNEPQTEKPVTYSNSSKNIELTDKDMPDLMFEVSSESVISGTVSTEDGKSLPPYIGIFARSEDGKSIGSNQNAVEAKKSADEVIKQSPFKIGKLSGGKYKIFGNVGEYFIKSVKLNGNDVTDSFIEVKEGEELKNVQVVLSGQTGTLKGKVDGYTAPERVLVILLKSGIIASEAKYSNIGGRLKADGTFEIKAPAGDYSVFILTAKNEPKTEAEVEEWFKKMLKDASKVQIKIGEVANITLKMPSN
jgi:hypothetical protein